MVIIISAIVISVGMRMRLWITVIVVRAVCGATVTIDGVRLEIYSCIGK